ncbi:gluconate 2-dehydrogenase subunit 3 family protein [Thalassotalea sp. HSM 43]|uniref:gluconate 2-dehydrogenase subunit 3 family protein n=1 Tax=Thalassotalea sp. HSM 43 TaxID=2552945 RepID=UPI0010810435|nr:gluconate 2-dehydrogenase subunit 3 family protein [Thalassotalea sp. HSM 43]QBY04113.1 gluconate 2-dehydrogenase subunit 3 family protein [Thalassotalea sp. HSM 43]
MNSFFDKEYQPPKAILSRISRRQFLKSAAMSSAISMAPVSLAFANSASKVDISQDPWLTLDVAMQHLLPSSDTGPGAKEFQAINYLVNLLNEQPIDEEEKQFVRNGVGWLNGYTQKHYQQPFSKLSHDDKEKALRAISKSRAGENWLSTLISYVFEAMLAPSSYGGNPDGIGWQWLQHKAGFPMPDKGKRYYELTAYGNIDVRQEPQQDKDNKAR